MFGNGSILVVLFVVLGTACLLGLIRMMGFYGAATQDYAFTEAASKPHHARPAHQAGTDQLLLVAILSAAAAAELEVESVRIHEIHEVVVPPASHDWGAQGRQMIFQSHRLRS